MDREDGAPRRRERDPTAAADDPPPPSPPGGDAPAVGSGEGATAGLDDPFAGFGEWAGEADTRAYASL